MTRALVLVLALLLGAVPAVAADEPANTARSTELKEQGNPDSRTITTLREGTAVKVTQRAGGWAKVDAGGQVGWVRVFHLRFTAIAETSTASGASGAFSGFSNLFGGTRQTSKGATIATTGIRGLSPEDLKNANPDAEALKRVESYRADKGAAERFAKDGKLAATQVDYEARR